MKSTITIKNMEKFICKKRRLSSEEKKLPIVDEQKRNLEKTEKSRTPLIWKKLTSENLDCDYTLLYKAKEADALLEECERTISYNTGQLARVQVFGKWYDIPRKQVAHGDPNLSYTFSGNIVPARPWTPFLNKIRDRITEMTGYTFNFVLINRYQDGRDHMGEHKDDEKDLVRKSPIASLSLGQARDFVFRHECARGSQSKKTEPRRDIAPIKIELQHGSLLMMNYPTNCHWYHALPQRKKLPPAIRINMTFRNMVTQK